MKKFKNIISFFIILILLISYCYFVNISNFPKNIITYKVDSVEKSYKLMPFLSLKGDVQTVSSSQKEKYNLNLEFGNLAVKKVNLKVLENTKVMLVRKNGRN